MRYEAKHARPISNRRFAYRLAFIVSAGVLFAPVVHRLLHRFHFDDRQG